MYWNKPVLKDLGCRDTNNLMTKNFVVWTKSYVDAAKTESEAIHQSAAKDLRKGVMVVMKNHQAVTVPWLFMTRRTLMKELLRREEDDESYTDEMLNICAVEC